MNRPAAALTLALGLMACALPVLSANPAAATPASPASRGASQANGAGFERTLSLQGIGFQVSCANAGSLNRVRIQPKGLKVDNAAIEKDIEGTVSQAEVADLNADGSPEIYVYVNSAGSGSYGSLVAYAANRKKSLSEIHLPPLDEDAKAAKGYGGHDEFRIVKNVLVRRFPLYRENDRQSKPTGGARQIQYQLKAGEAGWILQAVRTIDD